MALSWAIKQNRTSSTLLLGRVGGEGTRVFVKALGWPVGVAAATAGGFPQFGVLAGLRGEPGSFFIWQHDLGPLVQCILRVITLRNGHDTKEKEKCIAVFRPVQGPSTDCEHTL